MSLRVYHADLNPSVDPFSFRQSAARAAELVASGQGIYIQLADGRKAVQLHRCRASITDQLNARMGTTTFDSPTKMPPREVPGVFFRLPNSPTWMLQHRMVTFMESTV